MIISYSIISLIGGLAGAIFLERTPDLTFKLVIPWLLGFATLLFAVIGKPISAWAAKKATVKPSIHGVADIRRSTATGHRPVRRVFRRWHRRADAGRALLHRAG